MAIYPHLADAYREALATGDPVWTLREAVARELARNGDDRERVLSDLAELQLRLQDEGLDELEDALLDVIGFITGFSSSRFRL